MATEKQIAANRANALKSTGPRTSVGRKKSAGNSTRHGVLARTVVLDTESKDLFIHLLTALQHDLQPETAVEHSLVETMAVARWRQMRIWNMERARLVDEINRQNSVPLPPEHTIENQTAPSRAAHAFHFITVSSRSLDLMNRYESRYVTQYNKSLATLMALRANRESAKRTQLTPEESTL